VTIRKRRFGVADLSRNGDTMSMSIPRRYGAGLLAGGLLAAPLILASSAHATDAKAQMGQIEAQLAAQNLRINDQERRLAEQRALIESQGLEIRALRDQREQILAEIRAGRSADPAGLAPGSSTPVQLAARQAPPEIPGGLPTGPVGEAPPSPERRLEEDVAAIPPGLGVLTPNGVLIVEPSLEYTRSSANRLVFRGVEIVPGFQLGVIDANDADRDSIVGTLTARYGIGDRFEIEGRIPYVYRHDRVTTLAQRDESITRTTKLEGQDIGDVEVSARFQISKGLPGKPIFVANARVKPPTGESPYDVGYDEFGVATSLATGSGFWATELGVTMLYPTDPAVIFAGLSYLYHIPRNIDKVIGEVMVGKVDPGDSIGANIGFGLGLNPRFSVSFGYSHNFIFATESEYGETIQRSNTLQVGALQMGLSYRLTERLTLSNSFEFGVTSDAPDMRVVFRLPYRF
jgi:hypothetical protein